MVLALASSSLMVGCGMWTRGPEVGVSDQVIHRRTERRPSLQYQAAAVQKGLHLEVSAVQLCDRVEVDDIQRTHRYDRVSKAPGWMAGLALAGAAGVGTGSYLLARADHYPEHVPSGSDALTRNEARAWGATSAAVGGVVLAAAMIHWIIVSRDDTETEVFHKDGGAVAQGVACARSEPAPGVNVWLATRRGRVQVGSTGDDGTLAVELNDVVPPAAVVGADWEKRASVGTGDRVMMDVDLEPVRHWYEARQWADADLQACAGPERADACDGIRGYLAAFPDGEHAPQARQLLARAKAALAQIAAREQAEAAAAAQEQQRIEAEREAAAERQREELERRRRVEEEQYQRQLERRQQALEQEREHAREQRERRAARQKCEAACRSSCERSGSCYRQCMSTQCK